MLNYHRYTREELISFTENRGLQVSLCKALFCRPTKGNLIQTLKQADADRTFRFFDLPPELRTWIYRELLVLKNSYTCQSSILATCRQIHLEATNILYGDNFIEIKIRYDGILAHGKKCGTYQPRPFAQPRVEQTFDSLVWPDFLHRVQCLTIDLLSLGSAFVSTNEVPRLATVHNILYSLSAFLKDNHQLRWLELDLRRLTTIFAAKGLLRLLVQDIGTSVYPLRLLGQLKHLRIKGLPGRVSNLLEPTAITLRLTDQVHAGPAWSLLRQCQAAIATEFMLGRLAGVSNYPYHIPLSETFLFAAQELGMVFSLGCLVVEAFHWNVTDRRKYWEVARPGHVSEELMKRIDGLVRLDIELQLVLSSRANVAEVEQEEGTNIP